MKKILLVLLVACILCGCSQHSVSSINNSTVANLLPENIMGMHKFVALKGKPALEFIKKSHRGPIKYVKDIALVHYLGNDSMMLVWITEYPSSKLAENQTLLMVRGMKKFGGVWVNVEKVKLGNVTAYYVPGKNQYFFCKDNYVIYLMPVNMNNTSIVAFAERVYSIIP